MEGCLVCCWGRLIRAELNVNRTHHNKKSVWIFHQSFHNSSLCWCFPGHKRRIHLNDSIPTEQIKQLSSSSQSTLYNIVSCLSVNYVLYLYLWDCVRGQENYPPLIMDWTYLMRFSWWSWFLIAFIWRTGPAGRIMSSSFTSYID